MKVALVSFYLMETTIPLAKSLSDKGVHVHLYSLLPHMNQNTFVFDFTSNPQRLGFVDGKIMRKVFGEKLFNYVANLNTKVFIFPDRRIQKLFLIDLYFAYKLARYIRKERYDILHIIHTSPRFWRFLYFLIDKKKVIQTLHEVTSHVGKTIPGVKRNLNLMIQNSVPIIFHSEISKERYIQYRKQITNKAVNEDKLVLIRFGLFETYYCFSKQPAAKSMEGRFNILYFGRIEPSKGINILIAAAKLLQHKHAIHLTIAGKGERYFNFQDIMSYDFINRNLSNEEIVNLVEGCDVVVLPYISASQSGIPMTVYAFNKPIIASNIAGLKEVIQHMKTGLLVNNINPESFALAIETLLTNNNLKKHFQSKIQTTYRQGEFSWPFIANQTRDFYKKNLIFHKK